MPTNQVNFLITMMHIDKWMNIFWFIYFLNLKVILFGVLLLLIYVSGIIIFYFRQRKQLKKIL